MGSIGWVAVGVTAWVALSVPLALLLGVALRPRTVVLRAAPRRSAAWQRHTVPCAVRGILADPAA